ncbi:hypothetical protein EVAR_80342_1 [Eumeta japonica]|uniref:Uncharacterized protein n=1 Tax=Eumeta variegata TaxID=151549 RepID=A0A4C1X0I1_EUMVA|nr:hypothetical protein EVAR_80342_1 [Eumeta japonica]
MGWRGRVIALWMPQGRHLSIGNHVEIQLRLNLLAGAGSAGSAPEVTSSGGSERTFRGLWMKCEGGVS